MAVEAQTQIREYFQRLVEGAPENCYLAISTLAPGPNKAFKTAFFKVPKSLKNAVAHCREAAPTHHVFARPTLLAVRPTRGRGSMAKDVVAGTMVLYADLDESPDTGLAKLRQCPHPPTFVVHSGRGLHAYWQLSTFLNSPTAIAAKNRWLAQQVGADHCHDAARVLRVPGTYNHKTTPPTPTRLLTPQELGFTGRTYHPDEIPEAEAPTETQAPRTPAELPPDFLASLPKTLQQHILVGDPTDRSRNDFRVCVELLQRGCTEEQVLAVLLHPTWAVGAKSREKGPAYAERTVAAARQALNRPPTTPPTTTGGDVSRCTDQANAVRLCQHSQGLLRYVPGQGFLTYEAPRWVRGELSALKLAMNLERWINEESEATEDPETQAALRRWAQASASCKNLKSALELVRPLVQTDYEEADRDPLLVGAPNGIIDLETGQLRPPSPHYFITKLTAVPYDPDAPCPRWERFLHEVFAENEELIDYVQRAAGYGLTGSIDEQCLFLLYGSGANGKTTFVETLRLAWGDYARVTEFEQLLGDRADETIRRELAHLAGVRLLVATEVRQRHSFSEGLVKRLTGGDRLVGRLLYQEPFEFLPRFKVFLSTNHRPTVNETGDAFWRRMRLIPFTATFPPEKRDPKLRSSLQEELPGILAWAVRGAQKWLAKGLVAPSVVRGATSEYREQTDLLGQFLQEVCELRAGARTQSQQLYDRYTLWCSLCGERPLTRRHFTMALFERGFRRVSWGNRSMWVDLQLKESAQATIST